MVVAVSVKKNGEIFVAECGWLTRQDTGPADLSRRRIFVLQRGLPVCNHSDRNRNLELGQKFGQTGYNFFFQAEDGIRGKLVTGVQTCALPISLTNSTKVPTGTPVGPRGMVPRSDSVYAVP